MPKYVTPKKAEACAKEIFLWMKEHNLWDDCIIYVNGMRYCSYKLCGAEKVYEWKDEFEETHRVWAQKADPWEYLEYCNKHGHFISMSFEGILYEILNFYGNPEWCAKREAELLAIFEKYGYYYELGYAWSLSAYKN